MGLLLKISVIILILLGILYIVNCQSIISEESAIRQFTVIQSPATGQLHTIEIRGERINDRVADAIDALFSTAWLPRFVFRYFQRSSDTSQLFASRWILWKVSEL